MYLDLLPDHILRHELFPLLDYQDRATVNASLPKSYWIRTKLNPKKLLQLDMLYATHILKRALKCIELPPSIQKREVIKTLVTDVLPKCLIVAKYQSKFRTVLLDRITNISDEENPAYTEHPDIYTPEYKQEIVSACKTIRAKLDSTYSFQRDLPIMPLATTFVSS